MFSFFKKAKLKKFDYLFNDPSFIESLNFIYIHASELIKKASKRQIYFPYIRNEVNGFFMINFTVKEDNISIRIRDTRIRNDRDEAWMILFLDIDQVDKTFSRPRFELPSTFSPIQLRLMEVEMGSLLMKKILLLSHALDNPNVTESTDLPNHLISSETLSSPQGKLSIYKSDLEDIHINNELMESFVNLFSSLEIYQQKPEDAVL